MSNLPPVDPNHHVDSAAPDESAAPSTARKALGLAGEGVLFVIGEIVDAIMDFFGFWFMIALYIALIIGASLIHPTLGAIAFGLILLGHLAPAVFALGSAAKDGVDSVRRRRQR